MAINNESSTQVDEAVTRRKGFWSRFRRNSKRGTITNNDGDDEDVLYKWPSKAGIVPNAKPPNKNVPPHSRRVVKKQAPSAREAAFSGPPRYDWIDVETAAAIQLQAAYRRHCVMNQLEAQGHSTAAIRHRARRRDAAHTGFSDLFQCCGVGFVFDYEEEEMRRHEQYVAHKQERAEREAIMRQQYRRKQRERACENPLLEAFEVVEG